MVHLVVEADGSPRNVTLDPRASVGFGLDEQAIECVRGWKFKPALKDGKPVPVYATVEVSFRLSQLKWQLLRVSFDLHPEASLPHLVKAVYPSSALQRGMGLTLLCDIDEKGIPNNVHAEKPDGSTEEAGMITALRDWRFTPGSNSGSPVRTAATFVFGAVEVRQ